MQVWKKLGLVFCAQQENGYLFSHASYPTPLVLESGLVRVFFSPRDAQRRSSITYLDLKLEDEQFEIISLQKDPILVPGGRGAFDDSGVTVCSVLQLNEKLFMYYLGWNIAMTVPVRNSIGLAIGGLDSSRLMRSSVAPILDRFELDPYTLSYPWVLRINDEWMMWYGSHLRWFEQGADSYQHVIKVASSTDGVSWRRGGHIAIPLSGDKEFAVTRPCVLYEDGCFHMWYSIRSPDYKMGYATSNNGTDWVRKDEQLVFIENGETWDSNSMQYASVFNYCGRRYMLYNGNGFGRTGFGLAVQVL